MSAYFSLFKHKFITLLLVLFLITSCHSINSNNANNNIDYLYIFYDAGETLSLLPVIEKMEKENLKYKILLLGKGSLNAIEKSNFTKNIININKSCSNDFMIGESTSRENKMNEKILHEVTSCYNPKKVITGLVSSYQSQIINYYHHTSKVKLIGFYDGFSLPDLKIITPFNNKLDQILVPSNNIYDFLNEKNIMKDKVKIVGQPSIDKFILESKNTDIQKVKKILNIDPDKNIITFIGGYGKEYESVFQDFVQKSSSIENTFFIISIHPAVNGKFESDIIKKLNLKNFIVIKNEFPTVSLVTISNLVISQRSTVGIQSLFINVPSLYFDIENTSYTNIAIQQGWSPQLLINKNNFRNEIDKILKKKNTKILPKNIEEIIPKNSTEHIYSSLLIK